MVGNEPMDPNQDNLRLWSLLTVLPLLLSFTDESLIVKIISIDQEIVFNFIHNYVPD